MSSEELNKLIAAIEQASTGSDVRNSIVEAFETINSKGGNATRFAGHEAAYFLAKSEGRDSFDKWMRDLRMLLDAIGEYPEETSAKNIQSGNMFNYIDGILMRLNMINGGAYDPGPTPNASSTQIAPALKYLSTIKAMIKDAITDRGGTIEDYYTFEDYAKALEELRLWNLESKRITTNGTHRPEGDTLWSAVDVDVKPVVRPMTLTTEGTHEVPEGVDAWNPVTVRVPGANTGGGGGGGSSSGGGSSTSNVDLEFEHIDVSENGTYHPSESYDGINSVHVEINGLDPATLALQSFTVTFADEDGTILDVHENVQGGTSCIYEGSELDGKLPLKQTDDGAIHTFSYWSPNPTFVDRDMTCYANYAEAIYSTSESVNLSWEEICSGGGQVGNSKILNLLPYNGTGTYWSGNLHHKTVRFGPIMMDCVGTISSGTFGARKVWMSRNLLNYDTFIRDTLGGDSKNYSVTPVSGYFIGETVGGGTSVDDPELKAASLQLGWANSPLRTWLNTDFMEQCLPPMIREAIAPVPITCYSAPNNDINDKTLYESFRKMTDAHISLPGLSTISSAEKVNTYTLDNQKVWIPSTRDIFTGYSKLFRSASPTRIDEGSLNRTVATESTTRADLGDYDYMDTPDNWGEVVRYNDSWDTRPAALKSIYENIGDHAGLLKHVGFYPYEEQISSCRPEQREGINSFAYAVWPTRSFYEGDALAINQYGNSKDDMNRAADENLQSNTLNILKFSSYMATQKGICFCFAI